VTRGVRGPACIDPEETPLRGNFRPILGAQQATESDYIIYKNNNIGVLTKQSTKRLFFIAFMYLIL
jgi:hypothetical protein